jgi:hypothetical protein
MDKATADTKGDRYLPDGLSFGTKSLKLRARSSTSHSPSSIPSASPGPHRQQRRAMKNAVSSSSRSAVRTISANAMRTKNFIKLVSALSSGPERLKWNSGNSKPTLP